MVEDGPGIEDRKSFTVFTLELDWGSNGKADKEFSCLAVLFCSADEGVNFSGDCGRVIWSIDEEIVVRLAGVLSPDDEIDDDCLPVDKEHF